MKDEVRKDCKQCKYDKDMPFKCPKGFNEKSSKSRFVLGNCLNFREKNGVKEVKRIVKLVSKMPPSSISPVKLSDIDRTVIRKSLVKAIKAPTSKNWGKI